MIVRVFLLVFLCTGNVWAVGSLSSTDPNNHPEAFEAARRSVKEVLEKSGLPSGVGIKIMFTEDFSDSRVEQKAFTARGRFSWRVDLGPGRYAKGMGQLSLKTVGPDQPNLAHNAAEAAATAEINDADAISRKTVARKRRQAVFWESKWNRAVAKAQSSVLQTLQQRLGVNARSTDLQARPLSRQKGLLRVQVTSYGAPFELHEVVTVPLVRGRLQAPQMRSRLQLRIPLKGRARLLRRRLTR